MPKPWIAAGVVAAVITTAAVASGQAVEPEQTASWRAQVLNYLKSIDTKLGYLTRQPQQHTIMAPIFIQATHLVPGSKGEIAAGLPGFDCELTPGGDSDMKHCSNVTRAYCREMGHRRSTNLRFRDNPGSGEGKVLLSFVCTSADAL